ncbi:hypothetical protein FIM10_02070 [Sphingomonadales bacterium 56]|nr:hypothetical protein [Sphingomonadales bacterium 56]CAD7335286.1 hypothetical protein SPHS6_00422 [Sphingobium sp. S6]
MDTDAKQPWVTRWGRETDSWNVTEVDEENPEQDEEGGDSDGSGLPGRWLVGQAIARWSLTQPVDPTPEIVARVFNLPIELASDCMGFDLTVVGTLGQAVQVWAGLQDEAWIDQTVGAAALAFHLSPALIAEAVDAHPWMFLSGDRADLAAMAIEHDGE